MNVIRNYYLVKYIIKNNIIGSAEILEIFNKTEDQAVNLCKSIHEKGKGVVGVYPYDIAETKSSEATEVARSNKP